MITPRPIALLPIGLFLLLFLGSGVYFSSLGTDFAFYQISPAVAILPALILAILLGHEPFTEKVHSLMEGMGDTNIITMVVIYLLAGAYGAVAKSIGGVDATVNAGLSIIPGDLILPGLFLLAAFFSTAIGTSMGTVAAMAPIAVATAESAGLSLPLSVGAVISGAMFGDNLSMISDTTIAAVRTQGSNLQRKFILNFKIALPAMIFTIGLLYLSPHPTFEIADKPYSILAMLPYLAVFGMALVGVNVLIVLVIGIALAATMGFVILDTYSLVTLSKDIYQGYSSMMEIMVLSMFIGGLGELIKRQGGLAYMVKKIGEITYAIAGKNKSARVGELGIATLVSLADICTANNTVAILLSGEASKEIAEKENVDKDRAGVFIDNFSCVFQGILPYSAQILLAASLSGLSPLSLVTQVHYCYALGIVSVLAILLHRSGSQA